MPRFLKALCLLFIKNDALERINKSINNLYVSLR